MLLRLWRLDCFSIPFIFLPALYHHTNPAISLPDSHWNILLVDMDERSQDVWAVTRITRDHYLGAYLAWDGIKLLELGKLIS